MKNKPEKQIEKACENCIFFVVGAKDSSGRQCGCCKNGGPDGPETPSSIPSVTWIIASDVKNCRGWDGR